MNEKLYRRVTELGIKPDYVCEVGVWKPESSNILLFINDGISADLIEPDPSTVSELQEYFREFENVKIHNYAIYDKRGEIELFRKGASTFVGELPSSPALVNDNYTPDTKDSFMAQCIPFAELDHGSIDILSVDTEGCEWYVLMTMKSRPTIISLETHGKKYVNPFIKQIENWMSENNYSIWYKDKSDTVYFNQNKTEVDSDGLLKRIFNMIKR